MVMSLRPPVSQVVYLDDIVVFSNTLEEHVEHLRTMFKILRENILYGYPTKAASLTNHLKKNHSWEWSKECQKAFDKLKAAMIEGSVLAVSDYSKVFKVHTDTSDYAVGGVLIQKEHPITFESCKLNDTQKSNTLSKRRR
nr:uncharacterized protein LOC112709108 [Arachis hypogaea]